jgi:hypothetical protein
MEASGQPSEDQGLNLAVSVQTTCLSVITPCQLVSSTSHLQKVLCCPAASGSLQALMTPAGLASADMEHVC